MGLQETFNTVVEHLRQQGSKCQVGCSCKYRWEDKRCAVGILIPDDLYDEEAMENCCVDSYPIKGILMSLGHNIKLCSHLQDVHDHMPVDSWEEALRGVANHYHLDFPEPEAECVDENKFRAQIDDDGVLMLKDCTVEELEPMEVVC